MLATIPPEINAGWCEDVVLWAGFTWYHLLIYGVVALLAGVLGDFFIGRGWCKAPGYFLFLFVLACTGVYLFSANYIHTRGIRLLVTVEPPKVFCTISSLLWLGGAAVLHRRVVRRS